MRTFRVTEVRQEAEDIKSYRLMPVDPGEALGIIAPGCHIDVSPAPGIVRQYSLLNVPTERNAYWIGVKREPQSRGGSAALHDEIVLGSEVRVGEPRHNFHLSPSAAHHLLLAGGIGITPLLAMARALHAGGSAAFTLLYFPRSMAHAAFHDVPAAEGFSARAQVHHGLTPPQVQAVLETAVAQCTQDTHCYVCGPTPFMECAAQIAAARLGADAVHQEYFGRAVSEEEGAANRPFSVRLARTGMTVRVAADISIAEALSRAGVEVPVSCEQGVCGTCLTRVLGGCPDHRDVYLTDAEHAEGSQMTLCVSRALGDELVLDL